MAKVGARHIHRLELRIEKGQVSIETIECSNLAQNAVSLTTPTVELVMSLTRRRQASVPPWHGDPSRTVRLRTIHHRGRRLHSLRPRPGGGHLAGAEVRSRPDRQHSGRNQIRGRVSFLDAVKMQKAVISSKIEEEIIAAFNNVMSLCRLLPNWGLGFL